MLSRLRAKIGQRQAFFLRLSFGLGLIGLILHYVDFQELVYRLSRINLYFVLIYVMLIYADRALMAYKWEPLLRTVEINVPFGILFRLYMIGPMVTMILPVSIGLDLFRAYEVSRYKADIKSVFASIFVERAISFIAMMIVLLVGVSLASYLLRDTLTSFTQIWWAVGISGGIAILIVVVLILLFSERFDGWGLWVARLPLVKQIRQICLITRQYRYHLGTLRAVFALTLLEQLVPIGTNFLLARSLYVDISVLELMAIVPIIVLAIRLPISLGGLGVHEAMSVGLFSLVGVSPSEALLMSFLGRVLHLLIPLPWLLHHICNRNKATLYQMPFAAVKSE